MQGLLRGRGLRNGRSVLLRSGRGAEPARLRSGLDAKTKELIALTMGIAEGCPRCIGLHTEAAVKNDATDAEITETIDVCVLMGGGPALMHGLEALKALKSIREASE